MKSKQEGEEQSALSNIVRAPSLVEYVCNLPSIYGMVADDDLLLSAGFRDFIKI